MYSLFFSLLLVPVPTLGRPSEYGVAQDGVLTRKKILRNTLANGVEALTLDVFKIDVEKEGH